MSRAAFLAGLRSCAPELLPFVRLFYGGQSSYCWWDAEGRCRDVAQGEGCEQGDPLAPALFALGQHSALCSAASALHPAETLVAFLDDLYVVTTRGRARECRDTVVGAVERDCGIASNISKTRVYGPTESPPPPGVLFAQSTAPAAYWAGWADALPVLRQRLPAFAESCADSLAERGPNQRAWSPLQQRERSSKMRAGMRAPSGGPSLKAPALPGHKLG